MTNELPQQDEILLRIAQALERLAPKTQIMPNLAAFHAFVWDGAALNLDTAPSQQALPLGVFVGIDSQKQTLLENTRRFAHGKRANSALLWGARGTGKSSIIKSVHSALCNEGFEIKLIEVMAQEIATLPALLKILRANTDYKFVIFCDDFSFESQDQNSKALKSLLDGSLVGQSSHILFYATSNRRHLYAREAIENERAASLFDHEALDEKISLSDRFGLWLAFHHISQEQYLEMVQQYARYFDLKIHPNELNAQAIEWAATRGARSGRVAYQFMLSLL